MAIGEVLRAPTRTRHDWRRNRSARSPARAHCWPRLTWPSGSRRFCAPNPARPRDPGRHRAGRYTLIESLSVDLDRVAELVAKYDDLPLDTGDASVIALAEQLNIATVATLDRRDLSIMRPAHVPLIVGQTPEKNLLFTRSSSHAASLMSV